MNILWMTDPAAASIFACLGLAVLLLLYLLLLPLLQLPHRRRLLAQLPATENALSDSENSDEEDDEN